MHLRRIEIRDFRKLRHVVIDGLQDGLNVVVGDNEAGKSTVLAALRAVLFERHRVTGKTADAMLPYGSDVRPQVILNFEIDGAAWRLRKTFCRQPEAELEGPNGERLSGEAVEDRLAGLLGFTPPSSGGSKTEQHQGAYGLLWVEQGAAHDSLGIGGGRDAIAAALEAEVGQVLGGDRGRVLLAAAQERYETFWSKRGQPKGDWKSSSERVAALKQEKADLEARLAAYDSKVGQLDVRQAALFRYERDGQLASAEAEFAAASKAQGEAAKVEQALREATAAAGLAAARRDAIADRRAARALLTSRETAAQEEALRARSEAAESETLLHAAVAAVAAAELRFAGARAALDAATARVQALERADRRHAARQRLISFEAQLSACEDAERQRREAAAAAALVTLTLKAAVEIDELQKLCDQAAARIDAASVRLSFEPDGANAISVDGRDHPQGEPLGLARDAVLTLEGFGRIRVHPGGGLDALRRAAEEADRRLWSRLGEIGLAHPGEARAQLQRKAECEREAEAQRKVIAAIAPAGIAALRQAADAERALAETEIPVMAEESELGAAAVEPARGAARAAASEVDAAEDDRRQTETARAQADRAHAAIGERAAGARREAGALAAELAGLRGMETDEALAQRLAAAEAVHREAAVREAQAASAVEAADPEEARLRLVRADGACRNIRADIDTLQREKRDIEIELSALGRDGIGEQLGEAGGRLELETRRLLALAREAEAARLLHETLAVAQRETKDRWLGPVRQRIGPYLKLLHPGGDVILHEESFEIDGFMRDGRVEAFASLSMGAREQIAVITRLALAEILKAADRPSAVILDDALVNTDETRLDRMHLALHRAAERLQIIVLTCRERDFLQLGAPIIRLSV